MNSCKITDKKKTCLILTVLYFAIQIGFGMIAEKILYKIFSKELLLKYGDVVIYAAFFLTAVIIFWKSFWCDIKDFIKNVEKKFKWTFIFLITTLIFMVVIAIILDSVGIGKSVNEQAVEKAVAESGILYIVTVCFIGPVVEEFFYRGILFNVVKGKEKSVIRGIVAVLLSALVFAFIHVSFNDFAVTDLLANLPILLLGLTTAVLYWKTDNIICPILLHVAINSIGTFG